MWLMLVPSVADGIDACSRRARAKQSQKHCRQRVEAQMSPKPWQADRDTHAGRSRLRHQGPYPKTCQRGGQDGAGAVNHR